MAACGKQVESKKPEAARMVFGTSERPALLVTSASAGPGDYEYDDGMGNQVRHFLKLVSQSGRQDGRMAGRMVLNFELGSQFLCYEWPVRSSLPPSVHHPRWHYMCRWTAGDRRTLGRR